MFDWLKKQLARDQSPGVQTLADMFSKDVLPNKVNEYFAPKPEVRVRDVIRELPGAVENVAKEIAQGTARSFDWVGRKVAPTLLPGWKDTRGEAPTMEQFLYGGAEKRKDTAGDYAEVETGISAKKHKILAPTIGYALLALDMFPGGKGIKGVVKEIASTKNADEIFTILKGVAPDVDDIALKNISDVLKDVDTTKGVREVLDDLMPSRKEFVQDVASGEMRGSKQTFAPKDLSANKEIHKNTVVHLPEKGVYAKIDGATAARLQDEVKNIPFSAGDEVHLSDINRVKEGGAPMKEVTLEDVLKRSPNARTAVGGTEPKRPQGDKLVEKTVGVGSVPPAEGVTNIKELTIPEFNNGMEIDGWDDIYRKSNPETIDRIDKNANYLLADKKNHLKPILVNIDGKHMDVVDGHHRVAAYRIAGREDIPFTTKKETVKNVEAPKQPVFEGLKGTTLRTLDKLKGRSVVSNEFIQNLVRSPEVTKQERAAITEVLLSKGEKVNVKEFAEEVQAQLLPLERTDVQGGYANIYLPKNKQMDVRTDKQNYHEIVYQSPVKTSAGNVHFRRNTDVTPERYFAHTRAWDLADKQTRQVIEVQSDLYQKGRLENERNVDHMVWKDVDDAIYELGNHGYNPAKIPEILKKHNLSEAATNAIRTRAKMKTVVDIGERGMSSLEKMAELSSKIPHESYRQRASELKPLDTYAQTWWKRIAREEVQKAKDDGMDYVQFPTGRTAMEVEGLGGTGAREIFDNMDGRPLDMSVLRDGKVIRDTRTDQMWVVTQVTEDGEFDAIPVSRLDKAQQDAGLEHINDKAKALAVLEEEEPEIFNALMRYSETYDIGDAVDKGNTIYKFYESDVAAYLRGRYNAYKFTDAKGVEWMQVDLAGMTKGAPVEAYAVAPIAGIETDEEGNVTGFNPLKAALGFAVVGGVQKARGTSAYKEAVQNGKNVVRLSGRRARAIESYGLNEDSVGKVLDAQRRGAIPHPETVRLANAIPVDFNKLLSMQPGTIVRGEQAEAYKQAVAGYKGLTRKLRENHLAKPTDILLKKQYDDSMATLTRAYANLEALYSEAGRVVESSKIVPITRSPVVNANIQKVRSQLPPEAQVKFDMDIENLDLENPSEVMDFLIRSQDASWMSKIVEYYRASLLSGVTTNVVNASGNLLSTIADIPIRATAGGISKVRSALTGKPRDVYVGEAWKLLSEGVKSTNEAAVHAFRALKDEHYALQFNRSLVESGTSIPAIKGTKGKIIRLPYRLLSAMDMFFRTIKTNSEFEAQIYRIARQEGLEGMELLARTEELRRKPPTEMVEAITERADRALYLEDVTGFLQTIENAKNKHPWTQMLVPFYRTLVNLMREAYRLTPARFLSKDKWITQAGTRTEEIARATLGTLAGVGIMNAIMDGRLEVTGAAPTDAKERDTFYGVGKIPYAIRVGDEWVPYQKVQPFSTILFSASKLADIWDFHKKTGDMDPEGAANAANQLVSEISQFFVQQAPMQGIATFMEFLEGGKYNQGSLPAAGDFFAQMLGGFVPNIIYSGVRAVDPTIYITEGIGENIQKRIPGAQDELTPRRGVLGDVSERPGTPLERFLNPFNPSKSVKDPVYLELERLGTGAGFPQKQAFKQYLTTKEYDVLLQDVGPRTREAIWNLMLSRVYTNSRDDQKVEMIDDVVTRTRRESVGALFPHKRDKQMTMEKLLNVGATERQAYEIAEKQMPITEEQSVALASMFLKKRQEKGITPPTLQELLAR